MRTGFLGLAFAVTPVGVLPGLTQNSKHGELHELVLCGDLPVELAAFRARSQVFNAANNFKATLTSNGGMPHVPGATQWKSQALVIRSMSPDHRGNSENTP